LGFPLQFELIIERKINSMIDVGKLVSDCREDSFERLLSENLTCLSEDDINTDGYVISTLEAAVRCLFNSS